MRLLVAGITCAVSGLAAQHAAPVETARAFLARLERGLHGKDAPKAVTGFSTQVTVELDSKRLNASGVKATIDYLAPYYLKTHIKEAGREFIRGRGKGTPWMKEGKRSYLLQGREYARDRDSVNRDLSIAAGMTRYLYPARALSGLADLEGPTKVPLRVARGKTTPCWRVRGVAKDGRDFPLALTPAHRGSVRVTALFRVTDLYPLMIELTPLDAKTGKKAGATEQLRFHDHKRGFGGLLLPTRIVFRAEDLKDKRFKLLQKLELESFEPNPAGLTPASFRRPG